MNKSNILLLTSLLFFSCSNTKEEKGSIAATEEMATKTDIVQAVVEDNEGNEEEPKSEERKMTEEELQKEREYLEREIKVLRLYLDSVRCKEPSHEEYRKRCMEYYGIDVDSMGDDIYSPCSWCDQQLYVKHRMVRSHPESVFYYPEYEEQIEGGAKYTDEEAVSVMMRSGRNNGDWAFNALLFHDDKAALTYFYGNDIAMLDLVLLHNYERNKLLMKRAASLYSLPSYLKTLEIKHVLFYADRRKGVRKEFIRLISNIKDLPDPEMECSKYPPLLDILASKFTTYYNRFDYPLDLKDECVCYLAMLGQEYDDNFSMIGGRTKCGADIIGGIIFFQGFDFIDRVRSKNYFNNEEYKRVVEDGVHLGNPLNTSRGRFELRGSVNDLKGRVRDKDGYVNVRKSEDPKSEIIGTVKSGEDVILDIEDAIKEEKKSKMMKIETKDGLKGYIHYSRLEVYEEVSEYTKKKRKERHLKDYGRAL